MKRFSNKVLTVLASLTIITAVSIATSACYFFMYQPEEPDSLKDK